MSRSTAEWLLAELRDLEVHLEEAGREAEAREVHVSWLAVRRRYPEEE